ncbi:MAG TPA: ABC transporter ATP-binding protein [Acidocella sp.]|jgi:iron(III) transport system ATP-binding protein|uniref:ABC transporter ATP-binding protein n=1 Tax=Acidocella sp. TaxID=50710 RepID=UPI002BA73DD7|nr:ABC transporter ATP-binding protein [Acidocella sp.]HVE20541.1 ABC transporter ATP-binding protein [Acidocella sp.]
MTLLHLENVQKRYDQIQVLHDIGLQLATGEFLVLIGGSGSGKTTILRAAAGLERVTGGRIGLRGDIVDDPRASLFVPPAQRRLGMVFQDYALWPHLSCLDNVAAALPPRTPNRLKRAQEMLERMQIGALAQRRPQHLSGGQQQRVGIARALVAQPDLLLLDEPFSSLDPHIRDQLRNDIRGLARETGTASLLVSHDPTDVWRLADRVAVLEAGRITQLATPEILFTRPATPHVARFSGAQGGFPAVPAAENGASGIRLGGIFLPARPDHPGAPELTAYFRPEDIISRPAGPGLPAALAHCVFEAGAWLAYWRVAGLTALICSREAQKPGSDARLTIPEDKIFLYPHDKGSDRYVA